MIKIWNKKTKFCECCHKYSKHTCHSEFEGIDYRCPEMQTKQRYDRLLVVSWGLLESRLSFLLNMPMRFLISLFHAFQNGGCNMHAQETHQPGAETLLLLSHRIRDIHN